MVPVITLCQGVTIQNGLKLVANGTISLVVNDGSIKNEGDFIPDSSTVFFDGGTGSVVTGSHQTDFFNITLRGTGTKTNNGNAAIYNKLSVEGSTVLDADGADNSKIFTLKSSDSMTAYVDKLTNGDIIGNVTVERFINTGTAAGQHAKSWQFLATPTSGQTYFQAWQESGTVPSGYGTWVTGTGSGFDVSTATPSLKYYDQQSGNWIGVTNTGSSLQNQLGYMLFVRGDRTVTTSNGLPNNTNMRSKGSLYTAFNPPPAVTVMPGKFQSFGNPYASRIDFETLYENSNGINNVFYVWDPKLNGNWNAGGYQTLSAVTGYVPVAGSATTNYPAGVPSPYIESGQAVFVQGNQTGGNINFNENCKVAGSRLVNRQVLTNRGLPANRQFLFTTLFTSTGMIADGNVVAFETGFGNDINELDAKKINNSGENFGLLRNGINLSVEAHDEIAVTDTVFFQMQNLKQQPYQLRFAPMNLPATLTAFLIDKSENTTTALSVSDSSFFDFSITSTATSYAADRFYIVFKKATVVPVTILTVTAKRNNDQSNQVSWKVENEINLEKYTIERSVDGRNFNDIGQVPARNNTGGSFNYEYRDALPLIPVGFYRIKAISHNGQIQLSNVVKVERENSISSISIYPNPATGNIIHLFFKNQKKGKYQVKLTNKAGQLIYQNRFYIDQPLIEKAINPAVVLTEGTYQLSVIAEDGTGWTEQVLVR